MDKDVRLVRIAQSLFAPSLKLSAGLGVDVEPWDSMSGFNAQGPQRAEPFIRPPGSTIVD
jgi:hypothetical protein